MSYLFLDANVYLSFYLFGNDDLEEMEKAVKLIKDEEITLYSNPQLKREIARNRSGKIAQGMADVRKRSVGKEYPIYFKDYPEYEALRDAEKELAKAHKSLLAKAQKDISDGTLKADVLIHDLLELATELPEDDNLISKADLRCRLGNPPGKHGSIGDAMHWISLLDSPAWKIDIVSLDGDFASSLDPNSIHPFLGDEWKEGQVVGTAALFRSLKDYFKQRFPKISLSAEFEKDSLVQRLVESSNFQETHATIEELSKHSGYTKRQTRNLILALIENSQVGWIATDTDLLEFYTTLENDCWHIDEDILTEAAKLLGLKFDFFHLF